MSIKQVRTIVHLELNDEHFYFGSMKSLFDRFSPEDLGISYSSLRKYNLSPLKPYKNEKCTIRKGVIVTSHKEKTDSAESI
jgi:hypothetical protein